MRLRTNISLLAATLALAACSATGHKSAPHISKVLQETTGQNGRACVDASDIRGYGVLKADVMSINAFNDYYLATVLPGCINLETASRAFFQERYGEVCGGGMDKVSTGGDTCTIRHIFEFDNREAAFAAHDKALERQAELKQPSDNE